MFEPGTKVRITQFYKDNYPLWKPSDGTVIKILDQKQFRFSDLSKDERSIYSTKFGKQEIYTITSLLVNFDGEEHLVSDLGVEPI